MFFFDFGAALRSRLHYDLGKAPEPACVHDWNVVKMPSIQHCPGKLLAFWKCSEVTLNQKKQKYQCFPGCQHKIRRPKLRWGLKPGACGGSTDEAMTVLSSSYSTRTNLLHQTCNAMTLIERCKFVHSDLPVLV